MDRRKQGALAQDVSSFMHSTHHHSQACVNDFVGSYIFSVICVNGETAVQARLVQLFAAKELGLDRDMLSYRLRQLTILLPDLSETLTCASCNIRLIGCMELLTEKHNKLDAW